jgi:hypothetical protein
MNATGFKKALDVAGNSLRINSPTILTGLGVAGLITTVVLAVKATPKALLLLKESDEYLGYKTTSDPVTTIKVAWRPYAPAIIMGGVTVGCMIGANTINLRRNAALASIYSLTEATLREYQSKVVETIGEKKEKKIKDDIAKDRIDKNPSLNKGIIYTGKGDTLCYDTLSGRYFKSDMEFLRKIQNDVNRDIINHMWLSLNELYSELGLKGIKIGDDIGWNTDNLVEFEFSAQLSDEGVPTMVIDYATKPSPTFR